MFKNSNVGSVNICLHKTILHWLKSVEPKQTDQMSLQGLFSKMGHASTEEMTNIGPNRTLKCVIETQTDKVRLTNNVQLNFSH